MNIILDIGSLVYILSGVYWLSTIPSGWSTGLKT